MEDITDKILENNPQFKGGRKYKLCKFDDIADLKRNYSAVLNLTFYTPSSFDVQPFPVGDPHIGNLEHVLLLNPRFEQDVISKICYFDIVDRTSETIRGMLRYDYKCDMNEAQKEGATYLQLILSNDSSKRYNIYFLPLEGYLLLIFDISEDDDRENDREKAPLPQPEIKEDILLIQTHLRK